MTSRLPDRLPDVSGPVVSGPVVSGPVVSGRALAAAGIAGAVGAVAAGLALGWAASGVPVARAGDGSATVVLVGIMAVALAAANGYSKAYSP